MMSCRPFWVCGALGAVIGACSSETTPQSEGSAVTATADNVPTQSAPSASGPAIPTLPTNPTTVSTTPPVAGTTTAPDPVGTEPGVGGIGGGAATSAAGAGGTPGGGGSGGTGGDAGGATSGEAGSAASGSSGAAGSTPSGGGSGGAGGSTSGGGGSGGAADSAAGGAGTTQPSTCTPARPHDAGRTTVGLQHDGRQRDYVLHVPPGYDGTQRLPLVLDIHGYTSFATEQLDRSKWDDMADAETFVVVAPNGVNQAWNAGGLGSADIDDVAFIRTVIEEVTAELCIDDKRVYATGHSNGGAMTHKLGCEAADILAAIAPICGWTSGSCNPSRPIAVAAVRSLDDSTVRYEGGGIAPSAEADLDVWLGANQCADMPVVASHGDVCTTHTECVNGTQVMECHPRGEHNFFYATDNLLVPDTLWPFFRQFALP